MLTRRDHVLLRGPTALESWGVSDVQQMEQLETAERNTRVQICGQQMMRFRETAN